MRKQVKKNSNISIIETFVSDVVRDINEDVNDTQLLKDISKNLVSDIPKSKINTLDDSKVYLFVYNNILDFDLKPCKNINVAIKNAVNYIENVKIIYRGQVVKWDILNDETAFYINPFNNKIKLVNLGA